MIVTRTPLRISFFGGGTDLPEFYSKHGGCVINMAIDNYLYVSLRKRRDDLITIDTPFAHESCESYHHIEHPLIRAVLQKYSVGHGISIWVSSDVTHLGCGLGTDSAVIAGLLSGIFHLRNKSLSPLQLAEATAQLQLEIGDCGIQDAYGVVWGGYNYLKFNQDGSVDIQKLGVPPFLDNLMLFDTGEYRGSHNIQRAYKSHDTLFEIKRLAESFRLVPRDSQVKMFPEYLRSTWNFKRKTSASVTNRWIDEIYELAMQSGATGGKLLGAGGGGHFLFYVDKIYQMNVRRMLSNIGVIERKFGLDTCGSVVKEVEYDGRS